MRRLFVCISVFLMGLSACDDMHSNDLDGKWQLSAVEQAGVAIKVDTVWYNFQTSLFQYQLYSPTLDQFLFSNGYCSLAENGTLSLELVPTGLSVDEFLHLTDWEGARRVFSVEKHSTSQLVLSDQGKRYHFRRY